MPLPMPSFDLFTNYNYIMLNQCVPNHWLSSSLHGKLLYFPLSSRVFCRWLRYDCFFQFQCLMITIFRDDNWNGSVTKLLSFVRNEHNKVQTSVIFFFNLSLTTTMNLRLRGSLGSLNTLNANGGYLWAENCCTLANSWFIFSIFNLILCWKLRNAGLLGSTCALFAPGK